MPIATSRLVSTLVPGHPLPRSTLMKRSASTRCRSRAGITCRTVANARSAASSMPSTLADAVCNATATATACSSSNSSGGSSLPASSRYPPSGPRVASTG